MEIILEQFGISKLSHKAAGMAGADFNKLKEQREDTGPSMHRLDYRDKQMLRVREALRVLEVTPLSLIKTLYDSKYGSAYLNYNDQLRLEVSPEDHAKLTDIISAECDLSQLHSREDCVDEKVLYLYLEATDPQPNRWLAMR